MLWGIFVKMVIADRSAILVNTVFDSYVSYYSVELFVAAILYSIQIYCDFMSYSTVAVGAAQVLGFSITDNFNTPYFSRSIKEFWRRWHISLSMWFRNYLYIPLGGNRCSKAKKYFNLMVTFLLTTFAWIFFRAASISDGCYYIKRMFFKIDLWALSDGTLYTLGLDRIEMNILAAGLVILFLVDLLRHLKNKRIDIFLESQNLWFRWTIVFAFMYAIIIFGKYGVDFDAQQFIYLQF